MEVVDVSDDFQDFKWMIFRFHVSVQGYRVYPHVKVPFKGGQEIWGLRKNFQE